MLFKKFFIGLLLFLFIKIEIKAQADSVPFAKYTTTAGREKLYNNSVRTINKNLLLSLNDETESYWEDAFSSIELLDYKADWIRNRIVYAFDSVQYRTTGFQRALLELVYTAYPKLFVKNATALMRQTSNSKIFAMCAEYLLQNSNDEKTIALLKKLLINKIKNASDDAILKSLSFRLENKITQPANKILPQIFSKNFLSGNVVMYSIQRKDRNYPGIVLIRNKEGKFIRDSAGNIFNVPQLARSITNLPGYLTNGNTPQGIFRMHGFGISSSSFIGPTTNIQLTMPGETSLQLFMKDSTISDTAWTEDWYKKLLPPTVKNYSPLYGSFYAGKAGRTEIISHGTTVDPEYYKDQSYYPLTPTQGCLCTKELWSGSNGSRVYSDQQRLVNAIQSAGGPDGYCVVIELDDKKQPVNINEVLSFILRSESLK
ncbi:MAG TPA: hypothetical protein VIM07_02205 [Chitinophagaceae bacterium]